MSTSYNIIPLGFRFLPSDDEIITYHLSKIPGTPLPGLDGLMFEADVFGDSPPWELFYNTNSPSDAINGDNNIRYFFTQLKKKSKNGSKNFKRNVGEIGTWKGETKAVEIKDPNTQLTIGEKRNFTFRPNRVSFGKRKRSEDDHVDGCKWLMTEYGLAGETLNYEKSDSDYVFCRIKKKKVESQEEEDEVLQTNANNPSKLNVYESQFENDPINPSIDHDHDNRQAADYPQVPPVGGGNNDEYVGNINNDLFMISTGFEEEGLMLLPWNVDNFSDSNLESMEDFESFEKFFDDILCNS